MDSALMKNKDGHHHEDHASRKETILIPVARDEKTGTCEAMAADSKGQPRS